MSLLVRISTVSPVFNIELKLANFPFIFAPINFSPTCVWIAKAKSTGVDPEGSEITSPLGVRQKTSFS